MENGDGPYNVTTMDKVSPPPPLRAQSGVAAFSATRWTIKVSLAYLSVPRRLSRQTGFCHPTAAAHFPDITRFARLDDPTKPREGQDPVEDGDVARKEYAIGCPLHHPPSSGITIKWIPGPPSFQLAQRRLHRRMGCRLGTVTFHRPIRRLSNRC